MQMSKKIILSFEIELVYSDLFFPYLSIHICNKIRLLVLPLFILYNVILNIPFVIMNLLF